MGSFLIIEIVIAESNFQESDLCPNTTLDQDTNQNANTLTVADSTGIGEGSIISIDHYNYNTYYTRPFYSSSKSPALHYGIDMDYLSGSTINQMSFTYIDHDFKDHEVVQVISQSNNELTVAQLYGKEGFIYEDLGLYTHEQFVQTFGGTPSYFSGTKRVVLTDSTHKNFKKGDKLIINRSTLVDILYEDYYLSSSTTYDFTDDATIEGTFHMPEYRLTGSFLAPTESLYNNTSNGTNVGVTRYNEYFDYNNNIITSERTSSYYGAVTRSAHLKSSNGQIYSNNNPTTMWSAFVTNSYNFQEGEVEIDYSLFRFRNTGSIENVFEAATRFAVSFNTNRGAGGIGGTLFYNNNNIPSTEETGYWFGRYRDETYFGALNGGTSNNTRTFNIHGTPEFTSSRYVTEEREKVKIVRKQGTTSTYYQDQLIHEQDGFITPGPIFLSGQRYLTIYKIKVSSYYQLMILDTEESFNKNDVVLEGAYLEHNHTAGQRIRTNANKIKDALGHRNILHDYVNNPDTQIRPYRHGFTTSQNTGENYYNYYRQGAQNGSELIQDLQYNGATPTYQKTGTGYYIVYDLQTEVSMSAFSFLWSSAYQTYMEMAGEDIQIDVSNDINDPNPWTTVYGPTPDPKLTSKMLQSRFYHFTSGSTSARFLKISLNGNSRETSNRISKIGIHNFYSASVDLGNSVELYNADMFNVGDLVYFRNYKNPQPRNTFNNRDGDGIANLNENSDSTIVPNILGGNLTNDDIHGGLDIKYEIIAKSGNRITLDRTMASYPIDQDTIVYKWNQGGVTFTGDYNNVWDFYYYNWDDYANVYQVKGANFDFVDRFDMYYNRVTFLNSEWRDSSLSIRTNNRVYWGGIFRSNTIVLGGSQEYGIAISEDTQKKISRDLIMFNTLSGWQPSGTYLALQPSLTNMSSKRILIYNTIDKNTGNISYFINTPNENDLGSSISTPIVRISNNYMQDTDRNNQKLMAYSLGRNTRFSQDKIEAKNNYYAMGYGNDYYASKDFGGLRERSYGQFQWNPNIDTQQFPTLYYVQGQRYSFNTFGRFGNFGRGRFDDQDVPVLMYDHVTDSNFAGWQTAEQNSIRLKKSSTPNRYLLQNAYTDIRYNQQINHRHGGPFQGYQCRFNLTKSQNIQIQLNFDFKIIGQSHLYANSYSYGTQADGYINNYKLWNAFQPVLVLLDDKGITIDREYLGLSEVNNIVAYNKTFNLPEGEYTFAMFKRSTIQSIEYYSTFMEHGPIDLQLFSDSPNDAYAIRTNWDTYKILEGENRYEKDLLVKRGGTIDTLVRPANSIPVGNIKFRKLKL